MFLTPVLVMEQTKLMLKALKASMNNVQMTETYTKFFIAILKLKQFSVVTGHYFENALQDPRQLLKSTPAYDTTNRAARFFFFVT